MLKIKNLNKKYKNIKILDDFNLEIERGKILGLLGQNGSGKTSLMKILMNIGSMNSGEIFLDGEKLSRKTNKYISYLPDINFVSENLTIKQAIDTQKYFYDDFKIEKAKKLLNQLNLDENISIKKLSKGMKEKLNLILVLSREAKLYLLDEPIAGVDIITRNEILKLIIENISENSTAIITTHLIKDIEQIFDSVCFIKDGKSSEVFDVEEIRKNSGQSIEELYIKTMGGTLNA